jgi:hypothetical protein
LADDDDEICIKKGTLGITWTIIVADNSALNAYVQQKYKDVGIFHWPSTVCSSDL